MCYRPVQIDFFKAPAGSSEREPRYERVGEDPGGEQRKLKRQEVRPKGVQRFEAGEMMQRLAETDAYKRHDDIRDEGAAELVRGLEEAADKDRVEEREDEKCHTEGKGVCVHQRVRPVHRGAGEKSHPYYNSNAHDKQRAQLDKADEEVLALYDIALGEGQQRGKENVVGFPRALKALEYAERDEEHAAQDRIARYEEHQPESNEQI